MTLFNSTTYLALEGGHINATPFSLDIDGITLQGLWRPVPNNEAAGHRFGDLISVYGYPDFVLGATGAQLPWRDIIDKGKAAGLVSGYFRLPVGDDLQIPDLAGVELCELGEVVSVTLDCCFNEIEQQFRKNLRYDLRKSAQMFTAVQVDDEASEFCKIYHENMKRLAAKDVYFFSEHYIRTLLTIDGCYCRFIALDGEIAATAIFIEHGDRIFYHLGATSDKMLHLGPIKNLLATEMAAVCNGQFRTMVLGGGVGGRDDNLMRFKRGFSKKVERARALRIVFNPSVFAELSRGLPPTQFFPPYRDPAFGVTTPIAQTPCED